MHVHQIMEREYRNSTAGLAGNDECGPDVGVVRDVGAGILCGHAWNS
jgi:hypothetical protein